jgi:hypothetical protein
MKTKTKILNYLKSRGLVTRSMDGKVLARTSDLNDNRVVDIVELIRGFMEVHTESEPTDSSATEAVFKATTEMVVIKNGDGPPEAKEVFFSLRVPKPGPMIARDFVTADGSHTGPGVKMLTNIYIQGIAGNIKAGLACGKWNTEDHLKYAIGELCRAVESPLVIFPNEKSYRAVPR